MELNYKISVISEHFVVRPQYLSKSIVSANSHQLMITACLRFKRLFSLNSTFSITNLHVVYADMCVMLYSNVIIHRIYGIRPQISVRSGAIADLELELTVKH